MSDTKKPEIQDGLVPCEVCLKEVPLSAAQSEEVEDYFYYYCGIDCYKKWHEQNTKNKD